MVLGIASHDLQKELYLKWDNANYGPKVYVPGGTVELELGSWWWRAIEMHRKESGVIMPQMCY